MTIVDIIKYYTVYFYYDYNDYNGRFEKFLIKQDFHILYSFAIAAILYYKRAEDIFISFSKLSDRDVPLSHLFYMKDYTGYDLNSNYLQIDPTVHSPRLESYNTSRYALSSNDTLRFNS